MSLGRFLEREPNQRVEAGIGAELVLRGVDGGAGFGRLEAEVASAESASAAAPARGAGPPPARPATPSLPWSHWRFALRAWADAVRSADHRLVVLRDGARQLVRRERREDRQRDLAADALDVVRARNVSRSAAEPKPNSVQASSRTWSSVRISTSPPIGPEQFERADARVDLIADAADVDHRAVGAEFGKDSGKPGYQVCTPITRSG